jgi:hypothetical protein
LKEKAKSEGQKVNAKPLPFALCVPKQHFHLQNAADSLMKYLLPAPKVRQ